MWGAPSPPSPLQTDFHMHWKWNAAVSTAISAFAVCVSSISYFPNNINYQLTILCAIISDVCLISDSIMDHVYVLIRAIFCFFLLHALLVPHLLPLVKKDVGCLGLKRTREKKKKQELKAEKKKKNRNKETCDIHTWGTLGVNHTGT